MGVRFLGHLEKGHQNAFRVSTLAYALWSCTSAVNTPRDMTYLSFCIRVNAKVM